REQALAKARALDGLQVLLRDDHVGIDVDDLQWRRDPIQRGEFVHVTVSQIEPWILARSQPWSKANLRRPTLQRRPRSLPCRRRKGRNDGRSRGSARDGRYAPGSPHA